MSRYIRYPGITWQSPVDTAASLPVDATAGDARVTIDTNSVYVYGLDNTWHPISGGGSSNSFSTIDVDAGTNPVATSPTDTLTLTSSDNSITITGNALTDTIDLVAVGGGGGDSFYIMQTPLGTSPTATSATDTLTWANSDGLIDITGNALTDTIDLALDLASFPTASAGTTGFLTSTDWSTFNSKGSGDVVGPASSVDSEVALFDGVTGKLLKRASGTGPAKLTSGVLSVSNISLTTEVTGVLPIANGGTDLSALGSALQQLRVNAGGTALEYFTPAATGDVVGPASSVDNAIPRFDGTTGKLLQGPPTGTTLDDTGYLTLPSAGGYQFGSANDGIRLNTGNMEFWLNSGSRTSRMTLSDTTPHAGITIGPNSTGRVYLGSTNVAANNYIGGQTGSQFGGAGSMSVFAGNNTNTTTANLAGDLTMYAGNHASNNAAARGGDTSLTAGNNSNAGGSARGGNLTLGAGNAAGSGAGGIALIQGGTSGSGTQGYVQIGRTSSTNVNQLNNALGTPASDVLTLGNGPTGTAGDPDGYLRININGTDCYIPFWNV